MSELGFAHLSPGGLLEQIPPKYIKGHIVSWHLIFLFVQFSSDG